MPREAIDDADLGEFLAECDSILDHGATYAAVLDATRVRTAITARQLIEVRHWLATRGALLENHCAAAVVVVRSTLVRGVLAACFRIFRTPSVYRTMTSRQAGIELCERQLRGTTPSHPPESLEREHGDPAALPDVAPLLDLFDEPAYVVRGTGEILFANSAARDAHGAEPAWVAAAVSHDGADGAKPCRIARIGAGADLHVVIPAAASLAELPPSLRPVAESLAEGKSDKDIAHALDIQLTTVRTYVARVYRRLDVHSRSELVRRFGAAVTS